MLDRTSGKRLVFAAALAVSAFASLTAFSDSPDDRAVAEQTLAALPAGAATGPARDFVKEAKTALERAARLRSAHDDARAKIAEGLAREWAEAARDLAAAVEAESKAAQARRDATDAGVQVDRERALLEEGIAQAGRLRAQLEALERERKEPAPKTAAQPAQDAGAKAPARPAPAPAAKKDGGAK
jgi:hypothetical protein